MRPILEAYNSTSTSQGLSPGPDRGLDTMQRSA